MGGALHQALALEAVVSSPGPFPTFALSPYPVTRVPGLNNMPPLGSYDNYEMGLAKTQSRTRKLYETQSSENVVDIVIFSWVEKGTFLVGGLQTS